MCYLAAELIKMRCLLGWMAGWMDGVKKGKRSPDTIKIKVF